MKWLDLWLDHISLDLTGADLSNVDCLQHWRSPSRPLAGFTGPHDYWEVKKGVGNFRAATGIFFICVIKVQRNISKCPCHLIWGLGPLDSGTRAQWIGLELGLGGIGTRFWTPAEVADTARSDTAANSINFTYVHPDCQQNEQFLCATDVLNRWHLVSVSKFIIAIDRIQFRKV